MSVWETVIHFHSKLLLQPCGIPFRVRLPHYSEAFQNAMLHLKINKHLLSPSWHSFSLFSIITYVICFLKQSNMGMGTVGLVILTNEKQPAISTAIMTFGLLSVDTTVCSFSSCSWKINTEKDFKNSSSSPSKKLKRSQLLTFKCAIHLANTKKMPPPL